MLVDKDTGAYNPSFSIFLTFRDHLNNMGGISSLKYVLNNNNLFSIMETHVMH